MVHAIGMASRSTMTFIAISMRYGRVIAASNFNLKGAPKFATHKDAP